MAVSFSGGIRAKTFKKLTKNSAIVAAFNAPTLCYPVNQHKGTPLEPLVSVGNYVKTGQKLADAEDYFAVPIHASVSGTVSDIKMSDGKCVEIIIENDRKHTRVDLKTNINPEIYTTRELLWLIRDAGIIEPDGTPAHIKLTPAKSIKFLIANCAESDVYVTSKYKLLKHHAEDVVFGLKTAMRILNIKEAYIGIEADMNGMVNRFKKLLRYNTSIHLLKLKSKYPQSSEIHMIEAVTGGSEPSVVIDAQTLYWISRAVRYGECVTDRIITVSGSLTAHPSDFSVPIGTPASFLFDVAGGIISDNARIIRGGAIGGSEADVNATVTKNTAAFLALPKMTQVSGKSCGLCRKCVRKCPVWINPKALSHTEKNAEESIHCTGCGICSYICPKHQDPMKKILDMKKSQINE